MSASSNHFTRIFSFVFELFKKQLIDKEEKKILKEAIFKEQKELLTFIEDYKISQNEEVLKANFLEFLHKRKKRSSIPRQKPSKTGIFKPKFRKIMSHKLTSETQIKKFGFPDEETNEIIDDNAKNVGLPENMIAEDIIVCFSIAIQLKIYNFISIFILGRRRP